MSENNALNSLLEMSNNLSAINNFLKDAMEEIEDLKKRNLDNERIIKELKEKIDNPVRMADIVDSSDYATVSYVNELIQNRIVMLKNEVNNFSVRSSVSNSYGNNNIKDNCTKIRMLLDEIESISNDNKNVEIKPVNNEVKVEHSEDATVDVKSKQITNTTSTNSVKSKSKKKK